MGEPPGLFLSLLPAPQQSIMSCDYNKSLRGLYGDDVGVCNEMLDEGGDLDLNLGDGGEGEVVDGDSSDAGGDYDDDSEVDTDGGEYDEDYDSDYDE